MTYSNKFPALYLSAISDFIEEKSKFEFIDNNYRIFYTSGEGASMNIFVCYYYQ